MTEPIIRPLARPIGFITRGGCPQQAEHRSAPDWTYGEADPDAVRRCTDALDHVLAARGLPAAEIDGILADHPRSTFAHCLRLAVIVRDDNRAAQAGLAASIAAITPGGSAASEAAKRYAAAATICFAQYSELELDAHAASV